MFSIDEFHKTYDTITSEVVINGRRLSFFLPETIDRFIDAKNTMQNFPLWSRIWEASSVLASHISGLPVNHDKTFLEIGSGIGVVGISAAKAGHTITLSEYNPDALNFARANAVNNRCDDIRIRKLNWNDPNLDERFDYIVGSEILYKDEDIQPLFTVFKRYLKPDGEILIAESIKKTGANFWKEMQPFFDIKVKKQTLSSPDEQIHIVMFKMTFKKDSANG